VFDMHLTIKRSMSQTKPSSQDLNINHAWRLGCSHMALKQK